MPTENDLRKIQERLDRLAPGPAGVPLDLEAQIPKVMASLESVPCECGRIVDAREWVKAGIMEGKWNGEVRPDSVHSGPDYVPRVLKALASVPCPCGKVIDAREWVKQRLLSDPELVSKPPAQASVVPDGSLADAPNRPA